jgi:hypothetical protein
MCYYHICPGCGAHLDPGETTCDCQKELPWVTVPSDYGTHKELYKEEHSVNIIKVKFLKDGQPTHREAFNLADIIEKRVKIEVYKDKQWVKIDKSYFGMN